MGVCMGEWGMGVMKDILPIICFDGEREKGRWGREGRRMY